MIHSPATPTIALRRVGAVALVVAAVLGVSSCAVASDALSAVSDPRTEIALVAGDGAIDGVLSPFDHEHPAIANLDAALREAIQAAAIDANADGVEMIITSGWRSREFQQRLLDEATVNYGSVEEARKWVNTPDGSTHVTGKAVDIGYTDADSWLSQHGAAYGLCQVYANEMWHFELRVEPGGTCPEQIGDASEG